MDLLDRTLTQIENHDWGAPTYDSHLVNECHRLRNVPLRELGTEDLRMLIGQEIGLAHLVPLAIAQLEHDPWAGGHLYPGDLLKTTAEVPASYWSEHPTMIPRFQGVLDEIVRRNRFCTDEVLPAWHRAFGSHSGSSPRDPEQR